MVRVRFSTLFILSLALTALSVSFVLPSPASAQSNADLQAQINAHSDEIDQLNKEIAQYETQLNQIGADKKTLQDAINALNLQRQKVQTQIQVTQKQINSTQLQIQQLGNNITDIQKAIGADQAALAEDIRSIQQSDNQPIVARIFSKDTFAEAWKDTDAILQVQEAVQNQVSALAAQKDRLALTQAQSKQKQSNLVSQKNTLSSQQTTLTQTKNSKSQLLAETRASEAQYQKLLAQAKAELASFSTFAQNAGGSGLLSNQTSCDSWGCYYNQRDATWGNDALNGTQYRLKSDGCLVTSMAMILTHYGYRDVTPITINSNPANFAAYYPAYLLFTIHVDGMSVTRKSSYIDATLSTGNPVVVGLNAYGGTHYVVLVSGSKGNYVMRDPYIPNGKDIRFTSHYSLAQIFGVSKVVITS